MPQGTQTDDDLEDGLCDRDGCEELARYVETGDGNAVRDPELRCHEHKPGSGLWRDLRVAHAYEIFGDDSQATIDLFEDSAGEWRWRLVHDNGNIIADSGEGYASKQKAEQGIQSVKENVVGAPATVVTGDDDG